MSLLPSVIITCGPSYEPLDRVRRLTNFSTGELGMMLAGRMSKEGFRVICFKGVGATTKLTAPGVQMIEFTTNDHLYSMIAGIQERESVLAFFHAAALCDFKVKTIRTREQQESSDGKISSRAGDLYLTLEPALKLISLLRPIFPSSFIVGWKYEVDGIASEAVAKGLEQIQSNKTDACVVNGSAYGDGFGYLSASGTLDHVQRKIDLCDFLANRAKSFLQSKATGKT